MIMISMSQALKSCVIYSQVKIKTYCKHFYFIDLDEDVWMAINQNFKKENPRKYQEIILDDTNWNPKNKE